VINSRKTFVSQTRDTSKLENVDRINTFKDPARLHVDKNKFESPVDNGAFTMCLNGLDYPEGISDKNGGAVLTLSDAVYFCLIHIKPTAE